MTSAIHVETGGLRVGSCSSFAWNYSYPFASLQIRRDRLQIDASFFGLFRKSHMIPRESVKRVSIERGVFSQGIRIEHSCNDQPPFILFWSFSAKRVLEELLDAGYQAEEPTANKHRHSTPDRSESK